MEREDEDEAKEEVVRPERKIAILGTTPSRMEAPIAEDSGWEIWTIGPGGMNAHRWDRLFELHGVWPESFQEYLDALRAVKPPQQVWTMVPFPDCPTSVVYPKAHILEKFGRRMWFSSSISWLIALAIEEGPTDIGLFGIDLESGEEYISQFVGCAHFMDLARLVGINVHVPKACGLLRDLTPYPDRYETHFALTLEQKKKFLEGQSSQARSEMESAKAEVHRWEGRVLMSHELGATPEQIAEAEKKLLNHNIRLGDLNNQVQQLSGELGATQYYQRMFVWGMTDPN